MLLVPCSRSIFNSYLRMKPFFAPSWLFSFCNCSYQSDRSCRSAVRHLHIMSGLPDSTRDSFLLKGIQREGATGQRCSHLQITKELLCGIHRAWSQEPPSFNRTMLWAAFCLGFIGFMRAGEFTCLSLDAFTLDMLSPRNIVVHSDTHLSVHLKMSKTDPFGWG